MRPREARARCGATSSRVRRTSGRHAMRRREIARATPASSAVRAAPRSRRRVRTARPGRAPRRRRVGMEALVELLATQPRRMVKATRTASPTKIPAVRSPSGTAAKSETGRSSPDSIRSAELRETRLDGRVSSPNPKTPAPPAARGARVARAAAVPWEAREARGRALSRPAIRATSGRAGATTQMRANGSGSGTWGRRNPECLLDGPLSPLYLCVLLDLLLRVLGALCGPVHFFFLRRTP